MLKKFISSIIVISLISALLVMPAHARKLTSSQKIVRSGQFIASDRVSSSNIEATSGTGWAQIKGKSSIGSDTKTLNNSDGSDSTMFQYKSGTMDTTPKYVHSKVIYSFDAKGSTNVQLGIYNFRLYQWIQSDGNSRYLWTFYGQANQVWAAEDENPTDDERSIFRYETGIFNRSQTSHTIDVIFDVNGDTKGTVYVFLNNRYLGYYREHNRATSIDNFYGYEFRMLNGRKYKKDQWAKISSPDGNAPTHTEYYDVDLEDVVNDAGLGEDISGFNTDKLALKSTAVDQFMPAASSLPIQSTDESQPTFNKTVTIANGNDVTVTAPKDGNGNLLSSSSQEAARMLAGFYQKQDGKVGSRWIRLSFDQTITGDDSTEVRYNLAEEDDSLKQSLTFGSYGGTYRWTKLTLPGATDFGFTKDTKLNEAEGVSKAKYTDTYHVDFVIDRNPSADGNFIHYAFINGRLVAKGHCWTTSSKKSKLYDIRMYTTGDVTVELSDLTYYFYSDNTAEDNIFADVESPSDKVYWKDTSVSTVGSDIGFNGRACPGIWDSSDYTMKIVAAAYSSSEDKLLGSKTFDYTVDTPFTAANTTMLFPEASVNDVHHIKLFVWDMKNMIMTPLEKAFTVNK